MISLIKNNLRKQLCKIRRMKKPNKKSLIKNYKLQMKANKMKKIKRLLVRKETKKKKMKRMKKKKRKKLTKS